MEMPSRRTNNFPESGRGLGYVTPTIFGSTVGYLSDSLASCMVCFTSQSFLLYINISILCIFIYPLFLLSCILSLLSIMCH